MKAHDGATEKLQRIGGIRRYCMLLSTVVLLLTAGCAHAGTEAKGT